MATLLIVEDDEGIRRMLVRRLKRVGHSVATAVNGQEGIDRARATTPDIVFMDMHMPVVDGYEATRSLRAGGYQGLIIALTASAMVEESNRALDAGCDVFIAKPVGPDFEERVANILLEMKG